MAAVPAMMPLVMTECN